MSKTYEEKIEDLLWELLESNELEETIKTVQQWFYIESLWNSEILLRRDRGKIREIAVKVIQEKWMISEELAREEVYPKVTFSNDGDDELPFN